MTPPDDLTPDGRDERAEHAARLTRASMAIGLLGLDATVLTSVYYALEPELRRSFALRIAGDLGTGAVVTRLQPQRSSMLTTESVAERMARLVGQQLALPERVAELAPGSGGEASFEARVGRYGLRLGIERTEGRPVAAVAAALTAAGALPSPVAEALAARASALGGTVDLLADERRGTRRVLRLGLVLPATREVAMRIAALTIAAGIAPRQREYLMGSFTALAPGAPWLVVRVGASAEGLLPEVAVTYPVVPEQHLLNVWGTLRRVPDLARKLGALAAILEISAGALELRVTDTEPDLEVAFEIGRRPAALGAPA